MELKVLILDDEQIILEGLCSFPWEAYGCRVEGQAENGEKALALLDKIKPDIILSDIKMPGMSGLEFCDFARERGSDAEIILLTGYDNFEYAQQAIRLGVREYLLKPLNFREMKKVIEAVSMDVRKKYERKRYYEEITRRYQDSIPMLRSKFMSDLIHGYLKDRSDMEKQMKLLEIDLNRYVFVFGKEYETGEKHQDMEPTLWEFAVSNICQEILQGYCKQVIYEKDTTGNCFIMEFDSTALESQCVGRSIRACEEAQGTIKQLLGVGISFGISESDKDPYYMNRHYQQAVQSCEQSSYLGKAGIVQYQDIAGRMKEEWLITEGEKRSLFSHISTGDTEQVRVVLTGIFTGSCEDLEIIKVTALELLLNCLQYMGQGTEKFFSEGKGNSLLNNGIQNIYSCTEKSAVEEYLKRVFCFIAQQNTKDSVDRNQKTAEDITRYIQENYTRDLSMDNLTDCFGLSKTYISRLLRNYIHKSFLELLTEVRMKKAEELIAENKYKIHEIGEKVGYQDNSYFIKVFKKKYGVTPNEYRRIF